MGVENRQKYFEMVFEKEAKKVEIKYEFNALFDCCHMLGYRCDHWPPLLMNDQYNIL